MSNYTKIIKTFTPCIRFLWPVRIIDRQKFSEGKGVYVCNHYSVFDSLHFITDLFKGRAKFLIKEEAMQGYVGNKFLTYMGGIPVKRETVDMRAIKSCMTALKSDKPLVIFPEGTRNKSGDKVMGEFKDGPVVFAIKCKAPICPMMFYRPVRFFRRTYLIIGDKIDLSMYYGLKTSDVRDEATDLVRLEMEKLRFKMDQIVENKDKLKQVMKQEKADLKAMKKADKLSRKRSRSAKKDSRKGKFEVITDDTQSTIEVE